MLIVVCGLTGAGRGVSRVLGAISTDTTLGNTMNSVRVYSCLLYESKFVDGDTILIAPLCGGLSGGVCAVLPFRVEAGAFSSETDKFFSGPGLVASCLIFTCPLSVCLCLGSGAGGRGVFCLFSGLLVDTKVDSAVAETKYIVTLTN